MTAPYIKIDALKKTVINSVNITIASSLSIKSNRLTFPIVANVGNVDLCITSNPRTDIFKAAVQLRINPLETNADNHIFFISLGRFKYGSSIVNTNISPNGKDIIGGKDRHAFLPFVFAAYFVTLGCIYSSSVKLFGVLLGPIWLPMLCVIPGLALGTILRKISN